MNRLILALAAAAVLGSAAAIAQYSEPQTSPQAASPGVGLGVALVDQEKNAQKKSATVRVTVEGVKVTDPAMTGEKAARGQAHIHYRIDGGPVMATTATKMSFHELSSGSHQIEVTLAGNDHRPLTEPKTLTVEIP